MQFKEKKWMFINFNLWDSMIRVLEWCSLALTLRDLRGCSLRFEVSSLKSNDLLLFEMLSSFPLNQ
jgi:hypothetical protein